MTIADKLTLLASSKEALRIKLGLPTNLPFSEYYKHSYPFDPITLFAGGKQGVWYDPSDKSTLFQDVAGTVPVTKDGDPVGLILDKSQSLELSDEFMASPTPLNWTKYDSANTIVSLEDDAVKIVTNNSSGLTGYLELNTLSGAVINELTVGKTYLVSLKVKSSVGAMSVGLSLGGSASSSRVFTVGLNNPSEYQTVTFRLSVFDAQTNRYFIKLDRTGGTNAVLYVKDISVREIKGNHATQSLSVARPVYKTVNAMAWLFNDKTDDKMLVGLPTMTATVIKATDEGVSINHPVSITAGDYPITSMSALGRDYGHLIINKELSASEITQVTNYFNAKRGI